MSHADAMREVAFDSREKLARELFDVDTVGLKIQERALAGFTDLRLVQVEPVDLSITRAALYVTGWLQKSGFAVAWKLVERDERQRGRRTDLKLMYQELVIDWSGKKDVGGIASALDEKGIYGAYVRENKKIDD